MILYHNYIKSMRNHIDSATLYCDMYHTLALVIIMKFTITIEDISETQLPNVCRVLSQLKVGNIDSSVSPENETESFYLNVLNDISWEAFAVVDAIYRLGKVNDEMYVLNYEELKSILNLATERSISSRVGGVLRVAKRFNATPPLLIDSGFRSKQVSLNIDYIPILEERLLNWSEYYIEWLDENKLLKLKESFLEWIDKNS